MIKSKRQTKRQMRRKSGKKQRGGERARSTTLCVKSANMDVGTAGLPGFHAKWGNEYCGNNQNAGKKIRKSKRKQRGGNDVPENWVDVKRDWSKAYNPLATSRMTPNQNRYSWNQEGGHAWREHVRKVMSENKDEKNFGKILAIAKKTYNKKGGSRKKSTKNINQAGGHAWREHVKKVMSENKDEKNFGKILAIAKKTYNKK